METVKREIYSGIEEGIYENINSVCTKTDITDANFVINQTVYEAVTRNIGTTIYRMISAAIIYDGYSSLDSSMGGFDEIS